MRQPLRVGDVTRIRQNTSPMLASLDGEYVIERLLDSHLILIVGSNMNGYSYVLVDGMLGMVKSHLLRSI